MPLLPLRPTSLALGIALAAGPFGLVGCGGSSSGDVAPESPEAKKAGDAGRNAMADFMKSKSRPKRPAPR